MDKLLWSFWSWLWNDPSVTTSLPITTTTTSSSALATIKDITAETTPNFRLAATATTIGLPDSLDTRKRIENVVSEISSAINDTSFRIFNHTVNTLSNVTESESPLQSTPPPPTNHQTPSLIDSLVRSSHLTTSSTSIFPALHAPTAPHQQVQSIYSSFTTSSALFSSFSSTSSPTLQYDDVNNTYGSSSELFGNFSISLVSSSPAGNFTDDLSDVAISSGGFLSGGFGSYVGDEFLAELVNCSSLNGCCARTIENGSVVTWFQNGTINCTELAGGAELESTIHLIMVLTTAIVLGVIILATIIGNVFVIAAILLERNLQSVANYLILSLAVADLLVACLVMPLSAVYEVSKEWKLGPELCDMWTSCDVLCCTASILHLVAIALDRYWAVTNIDYIHQRTARRIGVMILVIWALSLLVSIAPLLGWKDPKWDERVSKDFQCIVSQDIGYQIFATASSFYVPLLVILILYWRIFQTARKRIRRRQQGVPFMAYIPGGLSHGSRIRIRGVMPSAADRFTVDLQCGEGYLQHDIALHLSVRPSEGVLVRNCYEYNAWGVEDRITACPIYYSQPFELEIHIEYTRYSIKVNGQHYCNFDHRFSLQRVSHIRIAGNTTLFYVGTEGAHHGEYDPPAFVESYQQGYPPPEHHHHHRHHHRDDYYD